MPRKKPSPGSRGFLRRRKPFREEKSRVLIVCEGEKTEPNYFHDFRKLNCLKKGWLKIEGGECTDPVNIVKRAKDLADDAFKEGIPFDEIWAVFDCDAHRKIPEAVQTADHNEINIAFSNPCFELWFLLHFADHHAHIERDKAKTKMKRHVRSYEENMNGMYQRLLPRQNKAIERAEFLKIMHSRNRDSKRKNPSTTVDLLVKSLQKRYPK